ncbi:MAG: FMN-binding negative transcriptional regulator [Flavobacteriales bacterium]|jgi:transcriptional regulator|nr:FMN-binding negative transcriptional regulator [Flavobacteriaceae bacterium]MDO7582466.1 FMN-binding negative transcriptional regulator [Flavobacteriaceae bacterium]MDO7591147.1 FMN-binding negative transcriptional regulator [Flavobacteriaceae bacterium]MDO7599765.1 FMN-binding negative transcriptional regulator [Flavobacteriaceae bacterium]MDO7602702.1 FMN-binding negative transcriptional regulator [Flavobacteriaceae bacterium]|tara:strand:- start:1016 stop:1639 length:624 start_codon:yes stop_codon:yes gene_type:complete
MNYPPKHHQEDRFENALELIKMYPLATVITSSSNKVLSTHIPLVYSDKGTLGTLVGHLDKFNPQINHFEDKDHNLEIIFHGPEVYISPSKYSTTQLPTWNYFKVHLRGKIILKKEPQDVKESLIAMTAFLEGEKPNYVLDENNPRMHAALDYIVGFHIKISSWEGKYKISQDKNKEDRKRAKQALIEGQSDVINHIERLYENHQTKS